MKLEPGDMAIHNGAYRGVPGSIGFIEDVHPCSDDGRTCEGYGGPKDFVDCPWKNRFTIFWSDTGMNDEMGCYDECLFFVSRDGKIIWKEGETS